MRVNHRMKVWPGDLWPGDMVLIDGRYRRLKMRTRKRWTDSSPRPFFLLADDGHGVIPKGKVSVEFQMKKGGCPRCSFKKRKKAPAVLPNCGNGGVNV